MTHNLKKAIQNLARSMEKECLAKSSQHFYLNNPELSIAFCSKAMVFMNAVKEAENL